MRRSIDWSHDVEHFRGRGLSKFTGTFLAEKTFVILDRSWNKTVHPLRVEKKNPTKFSRVDLQFYLISIQSIKLHANWKKLEKRHLREFRHCNEPLHKLIKKKKKRQVKISLRHVKILWPTYFGFSDKLKNEGLSVNDEQRMNVKSIRTWHTFQFYFFFPFKYF